MARRVSQLFLGSILIALPCRLASAAPGLLVDRSGQAIALRRPEPRLLKQPLVLMPQADYHQRRVAALDFGVLPASQPKLEQIKELDLLEQLELGAAAFASTVLLSLVEPWHGLGGVTSVQARPLAGQ